jgi:hypothetical protein
MPSDRMRASDVEREQVVALLRNAATEGRLDMDELDERTASAYAAKTRGELTELLIDIPAAHLPARQPSGGLKLPKAPGRARFTSRWSAPVRRTQAAADVIEYVAPPMRTHGYDMIHCTEEQMVFARSHRPVWTIVVAVVLFPLGLFALLYQERDHVVIDLREQGDRTEITAGGVAPRSLRRALSAMER